MHGAWLRSEHSTLDGQFFFWAENQDSAPADFDVLSRRDDAVDSTRGALRQRTPKIPSHPLQAPVLQLRAALAEQLHSLAAADLQPISASVWTPTSDGAPLLLRTAFSQPVDVAADGQAKPALAQWQVTGLATSPLAALTCLTQLDNGVNDKSTTTATIYHRVRLGKDLLFWSHVAKFALELLINQDYLPSVRSHSEGYMAAVWQPFLSDTHVQRRFDELAQMMPPVCRSYNLPTPTEAATSSILVEHFLAAVIDAAVRHWSAPMADPLTDPLAAPTGEQAIVQHWLRQLLNDQRRLNLPPQQAYQFYREWQAWTEQLQFTSDTNFRICFILQEPQEPATARGGPLWTLYYALQAFDNADLLITARDIWRIQQTNLRLGNRRLDQPQERLLAGLRAAARIFQPIAHSLRSPQPEFALLTTEEAYRFLRDVGPLMEGSGFGVVLPEWWNADKRTGLGLRMRLYANERSDEQADEGEMGGERRAHDHAQDGVFGAVRYDWELTLGGQRLARSEFEQMTAMRTPLLRVGKRWVELDPLQVQAAQRFIAERHPTGIMSLLQAVHVVQSFQHGDGESRATNPSATAFALPVGTPAVLPVDAVDVDGWLSDALRQLQFQQPEELIAEPQGFVGLLRPYQRRGVAWLAYLRRLGLGACLADDMGLGKTVQAIALLLHVRESESASAGSKRSHHPVLLVCPTSVVANWRREVERFAPSLRVMTHHGSGRFNDEAFMSAVAQHDLVVTSFGTARRDIDLLQRWRWSDLILDEAQNIKNPTAKQTQAMRGLSARNRIALTGTPVENRLSELWSIIDFLNPGYLEAHERFRQRYIVPIERYNDDERAAELRRIVQPFLLRRVKSDPTIISDLPEKNEMVVYCSLTNEQAAIYERVVQEAIGILDASDGIQRRGLVLSLLTKLKQVTNHPAHYLKQPGPLPDRSGKLERLTEMLEEALSVGDHALVFTQFVEMGTLLQKHLREVFGVEVLFLHGGTPAPQRDQMVQLFQEEDGPPIFILSLRAGGSGLNLTRANHVFHFDRWWNPAVENQATDRAFRIGQHRNVQVHKFVVAGTLEERIHAIVEGKQNLADSIVGSGEQWLTELSTEQLREMLTLRREMLDD